jgi:hypothetical protein
MTTRPHHIQLAGRKVSVSVLECLLKITLVGVALLSSNATVFRRRDRDKARLVWNGAASYHFVKH